MEIEKDLLFNFTSIIITLLLIFVCSLTIFHRLKIRWPVTVNCWFCNKNTKIWRQELDWWLCPSCKQYNGFSKDGSYNYSIPAQYKLVQNNSMKFYAKPIKTKSSIFHNGLCTQCNVNEELKIRELSRFEPKNFWNYDWELQQYRQQLEEKYTLCSKCSEVVHDVLCKQSSWLTRYKMMFFKQKPVQAIVNNGSKYEKIFRLISTILSSSTIYYMGSWPIPCTGLLIQLGACITSPANRRTSDMFLTFLWICIGILTPFKDLKLLKSDFNTDYFHLEHITQYHAILMLATAIGFANIRTKSYTLSSRGVMSFKKLESPSKRNSGTLSPIPRANITPTTPESEKEVTHVKTTPNSPVNITNLLMTPASVEAPVPIRATQVFQSPMTFHKQAGFSFYSNTEVQKNGFDESLSTLSSLSLSATPTKKSFKKAKMFETRVYGTKSSDLFTKSRRPILSPPKLKSWVAGGYWQAGMDEPALSRSSSRSSGFGSAGSNLALSQEPSLYNDFDRCSVLSDTTQCCHHAKSNKGNFSSFVRPESPRPLFPRTFKPHKALSDTGFSDVPTVKTRSTQEITTQTGQTVLATPTWLPALLCGSLIFNMIVLCTILLR
ncbi:uncharacterized protein LOC107273592 [Cephus cinctus]|uniref:Uncharacterized protein LOC107273592 n=1 Tax=Cephus cinctus TaxID=211228 RepID=A0AAJ7FTE8_CEPCN|nr:uncharacterized protein LOC107273592 [Cephus cinctus]